MCQNGLFTICLSLVHDVLDMLKSTSTYCWSHLFTNSENLFAHLIIFVSMLPLKSLSPLLGTEPPLSFIYFSHVRKLKYSEFQNLVGFITVSRTYIPFIQTRILTLPLENHYINFWYTNPVCLILKRYYTKMLFIFINYSNKKSLSVNVKS